MIRIVVRERIKNGEKEKAIELFREMVEATRKEEGNISFNLLESVEDPNTLAVSEAWESQQSVENHLESQHSKRLRPLLDQCFAEPSRIEIYREIL